MSYAISSSTLNGNLLGGLDAEALRVRGWPRRRFLIESALPRLPPLLQTLASQPLQALFDRYQGPLSFGRGAKTVQSLDSQAHPSHLFAMGLTVYLHELTPWYAELPPLLDQLERELQVPAGCARIAAFASPRGDGLPAHFDGEDVISIQLQGRKRFRVAPVEGLPWPVGPQFGPGMLPADELYAQCEQGFPKEMPATAESIIMAPGSVLFLPRGIWHQTEALEDSLSVSIVLRPPTLADAMLHQLKQRLLRDPAWRRPLYGAPDLDAHAQDLLEQLPALVERLDVDALLRTSDETRLLGMDERSRFQRVPGSSLTLDNSAAPMQLTVRARDASWIERVTLQRPVGISLAPALRWIAEHDAAFDVASLKQQAPELAPESRKQLLIGLTQAGLLRVLA